MACGIAISFSQKTSASLYFILLPASGSLGKLKDNLYCSFILNLNTSENGNGNLTLQN